MVGFQPIGTRIPSYSILCQSKNITEPKHPEKDSRILERIQGVINGR